MASFAASIDVDAPPAEACAYLADHRHAITWDPTVVACDLVGGGAVGEGARFEATVTFYGRRLPIEFLLVEHGCPERVRFVASGKKVEGGISFEIEAAGAGSRIEYRLDLALTGMLRILGRGLDAAIEGIGERAADGIRRALAD